MYLYLPIRKLTVNHENSPSSTPSIMETEFLFVRNGDFENSSSTYEKHAADFWMLANNYDTMD